MDFASLNVNKYLSFALAGVCGVVSVSEASRENLHSRTGFPMGRICVIPNAVDGGEFEPPEARGAQRRSPTTVVLLSRLVFRKGIDVVLELIPKSCARWPELHFIIGGDGPKRKALEDMVLGEGLQERVEILGHIARDKVADLLGRGGIFLNCSLTESFCISILEAACSGCHVVASPVGGVPEVLPPHMITLGKDSSVDSMLAALEHSLARARSTDPIAQHKIAKELYTWDQVAQRTEDFYDQVVSAGAMDMREWYCSLFSLGPVFGPVTCIFVTLIHIMALALEFFVPTRDVDVALPSPTQREILCALQQGGRGADDDGARQGMLQRHLMFVGRAPHGSSQTNGCT